jgi:fimbrial chaperone protein
VPLLKSFCIAVAALCAGSLIHASPAFAQLAVEPLFLEVSPGQSVAIRARNTSDKPMTVEMLVQRRHVDQAGVQTRVDADNDFILFPPQAVLPPQGTQVFRLQPLPGDDAQSRSYFATVHQLPVALGDVEGGGAQLQIVFAFDAAVHVVPNNAEAKPELVGASLSTMMVPANAAADPASTPADAASASPAPAAGAGPQPVRQVEVPAVAITIRNDGNKYIYLQDLEFVATGIDQAGARVELPSWDQRAIVDAAGVTLVEPGAMRDFKLPLRDVPALKGVEVEIRHRPTL